MKKLLLITLTLSFVYSQCDATNWQDYYPDMEGCNLSGAQLQYSNLDGANLSFADFTQANLYGSSLIEANLTGANFSQTALSNINCSYANFSSAEFYMDTMENSIAIGADFSFATFEYLYLTGANFTDANFSYANIQQSGSWSVGADFLRANFSWAHISGTIDWRDMSFMFANFYNTDTSLDGISNSNFTGACFETLGDIDMGSNYGTPIYEDCATVGDDEWSVILDGLQDQINSLQEQVSECVNQQQLTDLNENISGQIAEVTTAYQTADASLQEQIDIINDAILDGLGDCEDCQGDTSNDGLVNVVDVVVLVGHILSNTDDCIEN